MEICELNNKKILIGLSAGINSAAVLCWLAQQDIKPNELHLFYAHFDEHSLDSLPFVMACVEYANTKFDKVVYKQTNNSILDFFKSIKMIPHPANSPCSRLLKIVPMMEYMVENKLDIDLIGYVREEKQRATKMRKRYGEESELKQFPIISESNEWCFEIVKKEIGWYPSIYDIRNNEGKRIFKHNNCLPCKI